MIKENKLIIFALSIIIFLVPVLSSCVDPIYDSEDPSTHINEFSGVKTTHRIDYENEELFSDATDYFYWQVKTVSKEILSRLAIMYSFGIEEGGYKIDEIDDIYVFEDGYDVESSNKSEYHDEIIINKDIFDYEIIEGELDVIEYYHWSWDLNESEYSQIDFIDEYIENYLYKFISAFILILEGENLEIGSANYDNFLNLSGESDEYIEEYVRSALLDFKKSGFSSIDNDELYLFITETIVGEPYENEIEFRSDQDELFKNYSENINNILTQTLENETRYISSPLLKFKDLKMGEILSFYQTDEIYPNEDYKKYNSIIFMNEEELQINNISFSFTALEGFEIELDIILRHHSAENGSIFELVDLEDVIIKDDDFYILELDIEDIINQSLENFSNNSESFDKPSYSISKNYIGYFDNFEFSGHKLVGYNDLEQDFLEIFFVQKNSDELKFNFSIFEIYFS